MASKYAIPNFGFGATGPWESGMMSNVHWAPHYGAEYRTKLVHYAGCWAEDTNYLFDLQNPRVPVEKLWAILLISCGVREGEKAQGLEMPQKLKPIRIENTKNCK